MNQDHNKSLFIEDETINLREIIGRYLVHWHWFVLSGIVCVALAFLYLRYTPSIYSAKTVVLITDDKKSGTSIELAAFEDLIGGADKNLDNEIEILRSRKIIGEAIRRLNLTISYFIKSRVAETEVYKNPIEIVFANQDSAFYKLKTRINLASISETQFELKNKEGEVISVNNFNENIDSEVGVFKVVYNPKKGTHYNFEIAANITPLNELVDAYKAQLKIEPVNKRSSVLNVSLNNAVQRKAVDFLDMLVHVYNEDAILDKNKVSKKTITFINDRLEIIGKNLDSINNNLKDFKTKNNLTDVEEEAKLTLQIFSQNTNSIIENTIQLKLIQSLRSDLNKQESNAEVLATNLGLQDLSIAESIKEYNELVLTKKRLLNSATELNPNVRVVTLQIDGLKSSLLQSLENAENGLQLTLKELESEDAKIKAKISGVPLQELELRDITLQQQITTVLYSYLLKKKEETAISLAVTVSNAKIIDKAYSSQVPISPKKNMIYLAALMLGGLIPFSIIYVINLLDTKVHNKKDIESQLSVPFLGDVPKSDNKEKVVIGNETRSSTAEAFRLIRTNLEFMLSSNRKQSKAIFVTSTTSGEGKSFISINLSATLALLGKKVLLMGMDLRAPKVTEYLGIPERKGITNYITDEDIQLEDIIFNIPEIKNLDIISSGAIPPNPAELLMTKRVENLFTIVKEEYDIVIVDTAPVNLVTDTLLIGKYADMFMYVVRANYLDKRLLGVPQELYNEKKLPNMAIVLNDTDPKRSYGYGYGGYGYGYVVVEKPWYKKIFSKDS